MTLWEGARRLPYFFSYGQPNGDARRSVLCPQCALQPMSAEPEMLQAHYSVNRTVMCARCSIVIGPASDAEMVEYE